MIRTFCDAVMVVALGFVAYNEWQRLFGFDGSNQIKRRLRDAEDELEISRAKLEEAGLVRRIR